ncbi:MAG TPA: hypothetical protein VF886_10370 [Roseiarcus sp.]
MDGVRGSSVGVNGFFHRSFIVLACFLTPLLPVIDGALDVAKGQQAEFHDGLAEIAAKHGLGRVWFGVEKNGRVLANVGLGGADPDQPCREPRQIDNRDCGRAADSGRQAHAGEQA